MSLIPKLQTVLSVVFILMTAGAISVIAQAPAAAESSSAKTATDAASTNEPLKETRKLSTALPEKTDPARTAAVSRETANADSVEVERAPKADASTLSKAPANRASIVPRSPQATNADKWQFQFSPYFWLAGVHGTAGVGNRTTTVDMSFGDVFDSLKFAFMGVFEARKGKWVVLTDLEYVSLKDERATPGPLFSSATARFKTFIFDPEVGYRLYEDPDKGASVDVLGGVRVWHVSTQLDFGAGILPAQQIQGSRTWVDGIAGLRGKAAVSEKIFVSGKFDLGGGGSKFTWQLFGGLGYNLTPKIALIGGYRVLDVNYNKNSFIYDMNQRGPIMGLGFKF
jgi:hypothetical protein